MPAEQVAQRAEASSCPSAANSTRPCRKRCAAIRCASSRSCSTSVQRHQIHPARPDRPAHPGAEPAKRDITIRCTITDTGIGIPPKLVPPVPALRTGRHLDHAPLRRHWAWPGDQRSGWRGPCTVKSASKARRHRSSFWFTAQLKPGHALPASTPARLPPAHHRRGAQACWRKTMPSMPRSPAICCTAPASRLTAHTTAPKPALARRQPVRPGADGHADAGHGRAGRHPRIRTLPGLQEGADSWPRRPTPSTTTATPAWPPWYEPSHRQARRPRRARRHPRPLAAAAPDPRHRKATRKMPNCSAHCRPGQQLPACRRYAAGWKPNLRLLAKFTETHSADFTNLRRMLNEENREEARRIADSLKGVFRPPWVPCISTRHPSPSNRPSVMAQRTLPAAADRPCRRGLPRPAQPAGHPSGKHQSAGHQH